MTMLQIVVLAIVQGLTEFLPVSSSAHLILVPVLLGWQDQSLSFDIAVHIGTLMAVVFYFRRELMGMVLDWLISLRGQMHTANSRLAWAVLWGTVPLGLAGILGKSFVETHLRSPLVIAVSTLIFGFLLWYAHLRGRRERSEEHLNWRDVMVIGVAQVLALIPGTSRSGITITAGLLSGLTPKAAARFSFLLSIPAISAAGLLMVIDVVQSGASLLWMNLVIGVFLSGVSAFICIHFFLILLDRIGMMPFVIYRLLLGGCLLVFFL